MGAGASVMIKRPFAELENEDPSASKETTRVTWTKKKIAQLLEFADSSQQNWRRVSSLIPNYGEANCRAKFAELRSLRIDSLWTPPEDARLAVLLKSRTDVNWFEISAMIDGRSPAQCRRRWAKLAPEALGAGKWGNREQIAIFRLVCKFGSSWKKVAEHLPRRTQNKIKTFFHLSVRKVKKSELFKFLKAMVVWPNYTNRNSFGGGH